jgi:hypothetical protein
MSGGRLLHRPLYAFMAHVKIKFRDDVFLAYKILLLPACVIGYEELGGKNCEWQNPKRTRTNRSSI